MKIRKPDDEKFFKDIVLKDILEEISNEDGTTSKNTPPSQTKKPFGKIIFFVIIAVMLLLFIIILFQLVTDATTTEKPLTKSPIAQKIIPQTNDNQAWKMEEDRAGNNKTVPPKVLKEEPAHETKMEIKSNTIKIKPIPLQKTERELAKEALRKQMLN